MKILYMTCPLDKAESMARTLLEERLVACANILPPASSLYWWEGTIEQAAEAVVVMKTADARSAAALARIKPTNPPVAARFEAFSGGLELANGYEELIDHAEQRQRFEPELAARRAAGRQAPPPDESFLAALAHGLPGCAGVAIGLDRLTAVAGGLSSVSEAMSFAHTVE